VQIELDRRYHAAGTQRTGLRPQHRRGIGHVHQDQPADDRVEGPVMRPVVDVTDHEPDVGQTALGRSRDRLPDRIRRLIDPDDLAARADKLGGDERHISRSRTQVEHAHVPADAGHLENRPRRGREHPALQVEPLELGGIAAKLVAGLRATHHVPLAVPPPSIAALRLKRGRAGKLVSSQPKRGGFRTIQVTRS